MITQRPFKMKQNVFSIFFKALILELLLKEIKQILKVESQNLNCHHKIENNKMTGTCKHFYKNDFYVFL